MTRCACAPPGENAARNGVEDRLTVLVGDLSDKASGVYDLITANIVAAAILSLAPHVPALLAPGAVFIASGIIDTRKEEVLAGLPRRRAGAVRCARETRLGVHRLPQAGGVRCRTAILRARSAAGAPALTGADAHHLAHVMRAHVGDTVLLCGPDALEYTGTVVSVGEGRVEFTVSEGLPSTAEPRCEVTLYAAYPKQGKLEEIIRHGVELGAARVIPFFSRYCVAAPKKEDAKNERYRRIAAEARQAVRARPGAGGRDAAAGLCRRVRRVCRV